MRTFQTVIDYNPEVEYTYNDLSHSFSDKLAKVTVERGINPVSQKWSVTISGHLDKVKAALRFTKEHIGSRRFQWTTPVGEPILVRCTESSLNFHSTVTAKLTLVFEQAFEP